MGLCAVENCAGKSRTKGLCNKHALRLRLTGTTDPGPKAPAPIEERFWRKVKRGNGDECWLFPSKYGNIQIGGKGSKNIMAHRFSYMLHHGPIPEGMVVMHKCDNPWCVNPDHLMAGTHADNTADMIAKGRKRTVAPLGGLNGKAVLTAQDVRFIRSKPDHSHAALARWLGVATSTVRGVRSGRTWSHIT